MENNQLARQRRNNRYFCIKSFASCEVRTNLRLKRGLGKRNLNPINTDGKVYRIFVSVATRNVNERKIEEVKVSPPGNGLVEAATRCQKWKSDGVNTWQVNSRQLGANWRFWEFVCRMPFSHLRRVEAIGFWCDAETSKSFVEWWGIEALKGPHIPETAQRRASTCW